MQHSVRSVMRRFCLLCIALPGAGWLGGCAAAASESNADISPEAQAALRQMSDTLGSAKAFSFQAEAVMDEPVGTGQMGQFTRHSKIIVRRPDMICAQVMQGTEPWALWCRGTNLTVLNKTDYATADVPGRIDQDLDAMVENYGLVMPVADLLFPDPYQVLTAEVQTGQYLGVHETDGVKCKHLLFSTPAVDWQIWIEDGKQALPRKLVLDYKNLPGRPRFTAVISDWNLSPSAGDEVFEPQLPKDARKVDMLDLLGTKEGD